MHRSPDSLLRNTMRLDSIFCAIAGVDLILFAGPVARLLGVGHSGGLMFLGVGLLGYAGYLFVASRREPVSFSEAWTFIAADFLWIAGSALLIALGPLTTAGNWIVGGVAAVTLVFAEGKLFGVRRLRRDDAKLAFGRQAA